MEESGTGAGSVQIITDLDGPKAYKELSEICRTCTKKLTYVTIQFEFLKSEMSKNTCLFGGNSVHFLTQI